jgi:hypothetical protein
VVVAGVVAAATVAVPAAALASGSGSPSAKPSPVASKSAAAASKSAAAASAAASKSAAAAASKSAASASKSAAAAASKSAAAASASKSAAAGSGTRVDRSLTGPAAVAALASRLGVSTGAARHALQQIGALSRQGGVDPTGPAFAAIARGLGVSPAQLAAALGGVKQDLAGK